MRISREKKYRTHSNHVCCHFKSRIYSFSTARSPPLASQNLCPALLAPPRAVGLFRVRSAGCRVQGLRGAGCRVQGEGLVHIHLAPPILGLLPGKGRCPPPRRRGRVHTHLVLFILISSTFG